MQLPDWFVRRVHEESGGRLRARWSAPLQMVVIEQRVGRARERKPPDVSSQPPWKQIDAWERWQRERDGVDLVMQIAPGTRMRCPRCAREVTLPVMKMAEAKCHACGSTFRAMYWPLGESLLERLRYIDPARGGIDRVFRDWEEGELDRERRMRRERHNATEAIWKEDAGRLLQIPQVGYTGRERYAQDTLSLRVPRRRDVRLP